MINSQMKMKKNILSKKLAFAVITVLTLLSIKSNGGLTFEEIDLIKNLKFCRSRSFYFTNLLPFPTIAYHITYLLLKHIQSSLSNMLFNSIRLINITIYILTVFTIYSILRNHYTGFIPLIQAIVLASDKLLKQNFIHSSNSAIAVFLISLSLLSIQNKSSLLAGLLLGFALSSSLGTFSIFPGLIILISLKRYNQLINKNIKIKKTLLNILKDLMIFVAIPLFIYIFNFWLLYKIQKFYSQNAKNFSLEFRATLKDLNNEPADKYLMDRSIVTIISQKHRSYINVDDDGTPYGSNNKEKNSLWTIIKVHTIEEGEKNPKNVNRFVKNGDYVKISNYGTKKCLRVFSDESEDKFKKIISVEHNDDVADEQDIWTIISDDYIVSRQSIVKFKHHRTGMELTMRNLSKIKRYPAKNAKKQATKTAKNGSDNISMSIDEISESENMTEEEYNDYIKQKFRKPVNGSFYSCQNSRKFYIADNKIHGYYKESHSDKKAREKIYSFPQKNFLQKFIEHNIEIYKANVRDLKKIFTNSALNDTKNTIQNNRFIRIILLGLSLIFPIIYILNYISLSKYDKGFYISNCAIFIFITHISSIVIGFLVYVDPIIIELSRSLSILITLSIFNTATLIPYLSIILSGSIKIENIGFNYIRNK